MSHPSPFGHKPDTELGDALREVLHADGEDRFVRAVVAASERVYGEAAPPPTLSVLVEWARPGLVAAMLLIALGAFSLGLWVGRTGAVAEATLGDPLVPVTDQPTVPALMASQEAPDWDVVLAAAWGR
ncbi:MAG: hypothetical protein PVH40_05720 [Gemmatimonadales bacterium]